MVKFTHFNQDGQPKMVDISDKKESIRIAIAQCSVLVNKLIYTSIVNNRGDKGDVLTVAQIAGIMAAKNTANIIPMCHSIMINGINIQFDWNIDEKADTFELIISTKVKTFASTGVEMEALVAASVTALTIYDMCKSISKNIIIGPTILQKKTGGKSDDYHNNHHST